MSDLEGFEAAVESAWNSIYRERCVCVFVCVYVCVCVCACACACVCVCVCVCVVIYIYPATCDDYGNCCFFARHTQAPVPISEERFEGLSRSMPAQLQAVIFADPYQWLPVIVVKICRIELG